MDTTERPDKSVPIRVPAELDDQLETAAKATRLSKQALMRLSMEKGLELVVRALTLSPEQITRAEDSVAA